MATKLKLEPEDFQGVAQSGGELCAFFNTYPGPFVHVLVSDILGVDAHGSCDDLSAGVRRQLISQQGMTLTLP